MREDVRVCEDACVRMCVWGCERCTLWYGVLRSMVLVLVFALLLRRLDVHQPVLLRELRQTQKIHTSNHQFTWVNGASQLDCLPMLCSQRGQGAVGLTGIDPFIYV